MAVNTPSRCERRTIKNRKNLMINGGEDPIRCGIRSLDNSNWLVLVFLGVIIGEKTVGFVVD